MAWRTSLQSNNSAHASQYTCYKSISHKRASSEQLLQYWPSECGKSLGEHVSPEWIWTEAYLAINKWGWVSYEELWRSRRVLSVETVGFDSNCIINSRGKKWLSYALSGMVSKITHSLIGQLSWRHRWNFRPLNFAPRTYEKSFKMA